MHGCLIIQLEVEIQDSIQIFLIDGFPSVLVLRLCLLPILLGDALGFAFQLCTPSDHIQRIFGPDRIIKRLGIRRRRADRKQVFHVLRFPFQCPAFLAQGLELIIIRMRLDGLLPVDQAGICIMFRPDRIAARRHDKRTKNPCSRTSQNNGGKQTGSQFSSMRQFLLTRTIRPRLFLTQPHHIPLKVVPSAASGSVLQGLFDDPCA